MRRRWTLLRDLAPFRSESGTVTILVALALVGLVAASALVVDVGRAYVAWSRLRAYAQTAALSGAQHLPADPQGAVAAACGALANDGQTCTSGTVTLIDDPTTGQPTEIRVALAASVATTLGAAVGVDAIPVSTSALAEVGPVDQLTGAAPLALPASECPCVPGQAYTLKVGAGDSGLGPGNFGALALGSPGAAQYAANLSEGYAGVLSVGESVDTEPGDVAGPTCSAVDARLAADPEDDWQTAPLTSPRVLLIPVVSVPAGEANGESSVTIVGFAAFFLESGCSCGEGQGQAQVVGTFLRRIAAFPTGGGGADYGLDSVRLVPPTP